MIRTLSRIQRILRVKKRRKTDGAELEYHCYLSVKRLLFLCGGYALPLRPVGTMHNAYLITYESSLAVNTKTRISSSLVVL